MKNLSGQLPIRVSLKKGLELRILPPQGHHTTGQSSSCPQTLKCFVYWKIGFEIGRITRSLTSLPTESILAIKSGDRSCVWINPLRLKNSSHTQGQFLNSEPNDHYLHFKNMVRILSCSAKNLSYHIALRRSLLCWDTLMAGSTEPPSGSQVALDITKATSCSVLTSLMHFWVQTECSIRHMKQ